MERPRNPYPTVDIVIELPGDRIVLVERRNPPLGWAIPGGFVDYGESVEHAAVREAKEETGLDVRLVDLLGVYSDPDRDPRFHTLSIVFVGTAAGEPSAGDDAKAARAFSKDEIPELVFDHPRIVRDYFEFKRTGRKPGPGGRDLATGDGDAR